MKTVFKEGDKVYCFVNGHGVIKKILDRSSYPIEVSFNDGDEIDYTLDGRLYDDSNPTLSFTEYTLQGFSQERQIELPEVGEWCLVRDSDPDDWRAVKFRGYEPNSIMRYITEHGFAYRQMKRIKILD